MNRRSFLRFLGKSTALAAAVATGVVDPEKLLWEPGEKTIFTPPAAGWKPNIIGVDLGYGESWSVLQEDVLGPFDQKAIEEAAKALADRIDQEAMRLYGLPDAAVDQRGISLRMIKEFDIRADRFPTRLDVLYGVGTLRPDMAIRVAADEGPAPEGAGLALPADWLERFMAGQRA